MARQAHRFTAEVARGTDLAASLGYGADQAHPKLHATVIETIGRI